MLRRRAWPRDLRADRGDLQWFGQPRQRVTPVEKGPETNSLDNLSRLCPIYLGLQYFGKFGKDFGETGVALHPRLQDRASFGDYCRGATPR